MWSQNGCTVRLFLPWSGESGDFVELIPCLPLLLTQGHFKLKRCDERFAILDGVIDGNARARRVDNASTGRIDEFRSDMLEGQQVAFLAVLGEHSLHAKRKRTRIWPGFHR